MAKTKLLQSTREALLEWMMQQLNQRLTAEMEKPEAKAIEAANKAIRGKYPEDEMVILRKYKCTRVDNCLRFVNNDSGQVFGVLFDYRESDRGRLADMPHCAGCRQNEAFPVSASVQKIVEAYTAKSDDQKAERSKKRQEYFSFLAACKTVEDVDAVVPLPDDLKARYLSGGALVAINPDVIASIKQEFSKAA